MPSSKRTTRLEKEFISIWRTNFRQDDYLHWSETAQRLGGMFDAISILNDNFKDKSEILQDLAFLQLIAQERMYLVDERRINMIRQQLWLVANEVEFVNRKFGGMGPVKHGLADLQKELARQQAH